MAEAKLIFITGPSGAGKSATAEEVAAKWPARCALLDFDGIRAFVKSGYVEPALAWNDEAERQWELARQVVVAMAKTYISNGVSVVLEVFATPQDYPRWKELFGGIPYKSFALLPNLDVVVARNDQREGTSKLTAGNIIQNYNWSVGWKDVADITVLDNGSIDVSHVADGIIKQSR